MANLKLYHAERSSSSWRVRWGLALKKVSYQSVLLDLLAKDQEKASFRELNPVGFVPCLEIDGKPLSESLAILEWLDETIPAPALYPKDPFARGQVRQLALLVVSGIQPLQALGVLDFHSKDIEKRAAYARHWIQKGLNHFEKLVARTAGDFSFKNELGLADLCLIPQCWNAARFGIDLTNYSKVNSIYERCLKTEACSSTAPK